MRALLRWGAEMAINFIVVLDIYAPLDGESHFPNNYFPHSFHHKEDADYLVKKVSDVGGVAHVIPKSQFTPELLSQARDGLFDSEPHAVTALSLYDKDERFTYDAGRLDMETHAKLAPLMQEYIKKGYSVRQIAHVMLGALQSVELEKVF